MLHIDDCVPGTVVKLDKPYKPGDFLSRRVLQQYNIKFSEWGGYTHGIIVEIAATSMMGKLRVPSSLGLVLYDAKTFLMYTDNVKPVIADFSPDELTLVRKPAGKGNSLVTPA